MDRRKVLAVFAGATALPLALGVARAQDAAMPMGEAEKVHAEQTKMVGSLSLAQSRLAASKASAAKVKEFAGFEVAEQETIGDILKSMMMAPTEAKGALMPPTPEETMAAIDAAGKDVLAKLEQASGKAFDQAYVTANLEGHQKLLTIQEDYLKVGKNREHLSVAKLARGQIREHIAHLEEMRAMLG